MSMMLGLGCVKVNYMSRGTMKSWASKWYTYVTHSVIVASGCLYTLHGMTITGGQVQPQKIYAGKVIEVLDQSTKLPLAVCRAMCSYLPSTWECVQRWDATGTVDNYGYSTNDSHIFQNPQVRLCNDRILWTSHNMVIADSQEGGECEIFYKPFCTGQAHISQLAVSPIQSDGSIWVAFVEEGYKGEKSTHHNNHMNICLLDSFSKRGSGKFFLMPTYQGKDRSERVQRLEFSPDARLLVAVGENQGVIVKDHAKDNGSIQYVTFPVDEAYYRINLYFRTSTAIMV